MSKKVCDDKNRWRNKSIGFRMSPEEAEELDTLVRLSGLSKQEYMISKVLEKTFEIQSNPRVYKALRNELVAVEKQLQKLNQEVDNSELFALTEYVCSLTNDLKGDANGFFERN